MDRRSFLKGALGLASALVLPPTVTENAEDVRRFWALDRTMVLSSLTSVDLTVEVGWLDLDALAALSGGPVRTSGTTPDQIRTLSRSDSAPLVIDAAADFETVMADIGRWMSVA
jgi:hypothetical protein